ncbi:thioredoxin trx1 [Coemansia sp. RSA 2167]|nr:thioredoxin trx1 [Coemansia sp. RSA 1591]KAJ1747483.1 thioredoxin trx1 [Coemansia sp. RSA 1752]KAJ1778041.1 thioredoxin trx1 [Coemansia sp. RSA 1938]KAJ1779544.1 thioredoxin trx1 [Coemansia sp. RSA 2167]KAJ2445989.1 thioredoxin trx1 [Coemansia sp. RSA 2440]KAJ2534104.1 thioredoxin trx1 [Coemansia sp. RSA 1935]
MGAATVHEFKDTQAFNDFIAKNEFVVIDFSATWCGPCKLISPKFTKLSEEHPDVKFVKLDVDEMGEIAQVYGVAAMPTFKFLRNAKNVDEFVGANPTKLTEKIKAFSEQAKAAQAAKETETTEEAAKETETTEEAAKVAAKETEEAAKAVKEAETTEDAD